MPKGISILILIMLWLMVPLDSVFAYTYSGGSGEPNNPYLIATAEDMNEIGAHSNDWDKHFLLIADINMVGFTGTQFNIIGNDVNSFTGVFDGNDHSISNFSYEYGYLLESIGIFRYVDDPNAEIKNLTLINPSFGAEHSYNVGTLVGEMINGSITDCHIEGGHIWGGSNIGGLVGRVANNNSEGGIINCSSSCYVRAVGTVSVFDVGGLVGVNYGQISNCHTTGDVNSLDSDIACSVGGLVGLNRGGSISNCYTTGSITTGDMYDGGTGGLVGYNRGGTISNCYATGYVKAGAYKAGGLVSTNTGSISNSYASCHVIGGVYYTGGLVGENTGNIVGCYVAGTVVGGTWVGGLVGSHHASLISNSFSMAVVSGNNEVGGLVGYIDSTDILNSYALGSVSGSNKVGGLVGSSYDGVKISYCYAAASVTGGNSTGGLIGYHNETEYMSCFWNSDINPSLTGIGNISDPNGVIGKTTENMKKESTFTNADWDFVEIWNIGENQTYPFLRAYLSADINHDDIVNFLDLAILSSHWLQSTQ